MVMTHFPHPVRMMNQGGMRDETSSDCNRDLMEIALGNGILNSEESRHDQRSMGRKEEKHL